MALTATTLSAAVTNVQNTITVASATGFAAGNFVLIDQELMLVSNSYVSGTTIPISLRGVDGTAAVAHASSALVNTFLGSDQPGPGAPNAVIPYQTQRPVVFKSYTAAGALDLPSPGTDVRYQVVGTAKAMTLAIPTKDLDGCLMTIYGTVGAAHTVTVSGGLGGGTTTSDVVTFHASVAQGVTFIASNALWNPVSGLVGGAATVAAAGLA